MRRLMPWLIVVVVAVPAGSGCAAFHRMRAANVDVDAKQAKRTEETVRAFEAQRNFAQFQAAQARWREGNVKACREALEEVLSRDPAHLEARMLLVQVLLSQEKFDLARGYLEQILAEAPANARAQHTMGLLLEIQGHQTQAREYYQRAHELEPDNRQYALSCTAPRAAPGHREDGAEPSGDIVAASTSAGESEQRPEGADRADIVEALADVERALAADDVQGARDLMAKAVSLDPETPRVPIRAAIAALRRGHPELAVFVLQPVADRFKDSAALLRTLGTAYYRQGDYAAAQRALEQALSLDNSNALAYVLMGCTLEKLGHAEAAQTHLEQARRLDPRLRLQR
jgi:tetratricopeptide (TPR) repeat protein